MASNTVKGLTVEINGDTKKLGKALQSVEKQSRSLSKELTDIQKILRFDSTNVDALTQKKELLTKAIKACADKLEILRDAEKQVQKQFEEGKASEEQVRALQREIMATETKMKDYQKSLDGTYKSLDKLGVETEDVKQATQQMAREAEAAKDSHTKLSEALATSNTKVDALTKELSDIDRMLKTNADSAELNAQRMRVLEDAWNACSEKLYYLKKAEAEAQEQFKKGEATEAQIRDIQRQIIETSQAMSKYEAELRGTATATQQLGDETETTEPHIDRIADRVNELNTRYEGLERQLKDVNGLLKELPKNTGLLAQKKELLAKSVKTAQEKLKALKTEQQSLRKQFQTGVISAEQYEDAFVELKTEMAKTSAELKLLTKEMRTFNSVTAQQIGSAGQNVKNFGNTVTQAGQSLMGVSAASGAALTGITKTAIDFESAWAGVTKTVNGTDAELETIKQGILDLAQSTASSAEDIAAVAEAAGQLGIATPDILTFTETMVRLGDSTNLSADEAATAIARLYNIMGGDISTVGNFGASLVDLGNNFATTESEIMEMATRLASAGSQMNMSEQEVLALAATLSSVGMEAEAGGSAISQIMISIDKAVALNSEELATWAETAGMSVGEFKRLWETDAVGALQAVFSGLSDAKAGGENLNLILEELGITTIRQSDTMRRLAGASDLLSSAVEVSNTAWTENNALTTESDKRYETTAAKIQQLKGTFTELCVQLGETLLPIIQKLVDGLSAVVTWFTNLDPSVQNIILVVMALVTAIGPLLISVGKVISAIGTIMTYAPQISAALTGAMNIIKVAFTGLKTVVMTGLGLLKTGITGLFSLIMAHPIIAIITAIVAAVIYLWNTSESFRKGVMGIFNLLVDFFKRVWNTVTGLFRAAGQLLTGDFSGCFETLKEIGSSWLDWFLTLPGKLWDIGQNLVKGLWEGICSLGQWLWDNVTSFFGGIIDWVAGLFGCASPSKKFEQIGKWLDQGLAEGISKNMDDPMNAAKEMANSVLGTMDSFDGMSVERSIRHGEMRRVLEVNTASDNTMLGKLDKIVSAIERGQVLTIDGKALVGSTAQMYDNRLGQRRALVARGAI